MIWRTSNPTEKVIVVKLSEAFCHSKDRYAILYYTERPYPHYTNDGEEVPYSAIEMWASLNGEEIQVTDELNEAAEKYAEDEMMSSLAERAFKAGADWQKQQDQETIELAEDHAMMAGRMQMKEEIERDNYLYPKSEYELDWLDELKKDLFEEGREAMKEEMMREEAIGGEVVKDIHSILSVKSGPLPMPTDLRFGDKIKLIIIKAAK